MSVKPLSFQTVDYKVSPEDDIFKYNSTEKKIARIAVLIFSIIIFPIGIVRLIGKAINHLATVYGFLPGVRRNEEERTMINDMRNHIFNSNDFKKNGTRLAIETADGVKLDGIHIKNENQNSKSAGEKKYIIQFNGNGGCYEEKYADLKKISEKTGADVICVNYRGVDESEGFPTGIDDLIMDGEAVVQYLHKQGVPYRNILLHGHSLGGGVATHVAALHQEEGDEIHCCNDRSFASMNQEVNALFLKFQTELNEFDRSLPKLMALGLKIITPLALFLTKVLGWNFKSLECFKDIKGHKFIIYDPEDKVIPYEKGALYKRLKDSQMTEEDKKAKLERKTQKENLENSKYTNLTDHQYRPKHRIKVDIGHNGPFSESVFNHYQSQVALAFRN
jgi:hypothetical protein